MTYNGSIPKTGSVVPLAKINSVYFLKTTQFCKADRKMLKDVNGKCCIYQGKILKKDETT